MKKLSVIAGTSVLLIFLLVLTGATLAFAQDTEPPEGAPQEESTSPVPFGPGGHGRRGARSPFGRWAWDAGIINFEEQKEVIAGALGIGVDELDAARASGKTIADLAEEQGVELTAVHEAVQALHIEWIDQALADGLITEDQAGQLKARVEAGGLGLGRFDCGGFGGGPVQLGGLIDPGAMHEALAAALGISVDELEAARAEGKTLAALVEELGVDPDDVRTAMEEAKADALAQAVEEGLITQEQADWIQSRSGGRIGGPGGRPFGGRGMGPNFAPRFQAQ